MKSQPPTISLGSQMLTPKDVGWVMQVGESTVAGWLDRGELPHFREGRLIRITSAALLEFILKRTKVERGYRRNPSVSLSVGGTELDATAWQRLERLIETAVESRLELLELVPP
jgi:excisionase family DNA binding protein